MSARSTSCCDAGAYRPLSERRSVRIVRLAALFGAACLGACATRGSTAARPIAFTHVTVIDMTGGPPRGDMTVVVDAGRITAVGVASDTPMPAGARVVDATGQYVIPGLWDMHVHGTPTS